MRPISQSTCILVVALSVAITLMAVPSYADHVCDHDGDGLDGPQCNGLDCNDFADACTFICDADGDGHDDINCGGDDCDDDNGARWPGNIEVCDSRDVDEDCDYTSFGLKDADGDGYTDATCCNDDPSGGSICGLDCNDGDAAVHRGLPDVCDGSDNDCDGATDEGAGVVAYTDADGDGWGSTPAGRTCDFTSGGTSPFTGDCQDDNAKVHPNATELCNQIDDNCDGEIDEGFDPGCL